MSIEELKAELEQRTREGLALEIENLPATIKSLTNQYAVRILLATLGFEESFGRWEVRRTNGVTPPIAAAIGNVAMDTLQLAIPDFIKEFIADLTKAEYLQEAGKRDFRYQLNRLITEQVGKWVEEEAKTQSQKIIASLKTSQEKK